MLFSAVKPRHPQTADLNEHDEHDESSPPRPYVDDEGLKTWDSATSSASATSSSEPDSMMLSTPPQPERVRKMDDLPQKVQNQPRLAVVLSTPESPAPKYGASGTPLLRMGDAAH